MKVYELMELLGKMPAGAAVQVARHPDEDMVGIREVTDFGEDDPQIIGIVGELVEIPGQDDEDNAATPPGATP